MTETTEIASTSVLLNAVSAAFAYVACADGNVDESEMKRFVSFIGSIHVLREQAPKDATHILKKYAAPFLEDFPKAEAHAHQAIAQVRGRADESSLVIRAAQVAIVADQELHKHEEIAMQRICTTLGVPADAF